MRGVGGVGSGGGGDALARRLVVLASGRRLQH